MWPANRVSCTQPSLPHRVMIAKLLGTHGGVGRDGVNDIEDGEEAARNLQQRSRV